MDKRNILHTEALKYFEQNNFKTLFKLPTGTGKSVLTIKILNKYKGKYLLVTPTIVLHKVDWKNEFIKFDLPSTESANVLIRDCIFCTPEFTYDLTCCVVVGDLVPGLLYSLLFSTTGVFCKVGDCLDFFGDL